MALAQVTRTTSGMAGPTSATTQATIDTLKQQIVQGGEISYTHINALKDLWNSFNNHYHTTTDVWFIPASGQNAPTYSTNQYDTDPESTSAQVTTNSVGVDITWAVAKGDLITYTTHNDLTAKFNSANGHWHTINDRSA